MSQLFEKKPVLALFALICVLSVVLSGCITPTPSAHVTSTPRPSIAGTPAVAVSPVPGSELVVSFIDVGQGDSVLVQSGGKNMLIDAGTLDSGSTVVSYLKARGVNTIDVLVATHPHSDHIGGMPAVLNAFPVKVVYDCGIPYTTQTYEDFLGLIDKKDITYKVPEPGDLIDFAPGVTVQVLSVDGNYEELNDKSIVLKATYGDTSFLFMGDAGFESESSLLKSGYDLKSDVLKVGHHGSKSSSGTSFLKAVKPKYSVIEVGADNPYGHPTRAAVDRLEAAGSTVYRTDYSGDIVLTSDGQGITVATERGTGTA